MSASWESTFSYWAQPPGQTENDRIQNAIGAIRKALNEDEKIRPLTKVYAQGSYRNRVNVRQDSDVDIGVLYTGNSFFPLYPEGTNKETFGNIDGDCSYSQFKEAVGKALIRKFGAGVVHRGNKAFDIHENTYRIDADVVPVFVHRRYNRDGSYICGVQLNPDDGGKIINWPERLFDDHTWPDQQYENGVSKNTATSRSYKGVVRILKKLRYVMEDKGIAAAKPVSGFLVECLVWNVPNSLFRKFTWDEDVQAALAHLWSNTQSLEQCNDWGEVSELQYLFRGSPASKREQVHAFVDAAWSYIGVR